MLGVAATCWSIWLRRNDLVLFFFKKTCLFSLTGGLFGNHWLRTWIILQKPYVRALVLNASQQLMQAAITFFS